MLHPLLLPQPAPTPRSNPGLLQRYFGQYRPAVQAVAGDRVEHLVWRMQNGALPTRNQVRRVPCPAQLLCMLCRESTVSSTGWRREGGPHPLAILHARDSPATASP